MFVILPCDIGFSCTSSKCRRCWDLNIVFESRNASCAICVEMMCQCIWRWELKATIGTDDVDFHSAGAENDCWMSMHHKNSSKSFKVRWAHSSTATSLPLSSTPTSFDSMNDIQDNSVAVPALSPSVSSSENSIQPSSPGEDDFQIKFVPFNAKFPSDDSSKKPTGSHSLSLSLVNFQVLNLTTECSLVVTPASSRLH